MKWIHVTFRHEFSEAIGEILDRHGIRDYVRYPMVQGRDSDGKHEGGKVFPGNMTVIQAVADDEQTDDVMESLRKFRDEKASHGHLKALVLVVERHL